LRNSRLFIWRKNIIDDERMNIIVMKSMATSFFMPFPSLIQLGIIMSRVPKVDGKFSLIAVHNNTSTHLT
jgi:hypothetical protein